MFGAFFLDCGFRVSELVALLVEGLLGRARGSAELSSLSDSLAESEASSVDSGALERISNLSLPSWGTDTCL